MNNLNHIEMSELEYNKEVEENDWEVLTEDDVKRLRADLQVYARIDGADESIIEEAVKIIQSLIPIIVIDSIERKITVYRKPKEVIMTTCTVVHSAVEEKIEEAVNRHRHNTKVQRMSKSASYKNIERYHGITIADAVKSYNENDGRTISINGSRSKSKKKSVQVLSAGIPTITNVEDGIEQFAEATANRIRQTGIVVDSVWKEGLISNYNMLREYIDNKDYFQLKEFLSVKNKDWRAFFVAYTGYELPPTDRETTKFLSIYAPF